MGHNNPQGAYISYRRVPLVHAGRASSPGLRSCRSTLLDSCRSVPTMANPPAALASGVSLMSVPLPAMLVAIVTVPALPASATISASFWWCLPVIAFDEQGYRVGYGRGYYDRLLKQCRPDVTKVGLCFEAPVPAIEDLHVYDVPMDYCITPSQVFRWKHKDRNL